MGARFRPIKMFHLSNIIFCLILVACQGDPSVDNLVELLDHNHLEDKNYFESGEKALREDPSRTEPRSITSKTRGIRETPRTRRLQHHSGGEFCNF